MGNLPKIEGNFTNKSFLSVDQLDKASIRNLFNKVPKFKKNSKKNIKSKDLEGKIIAILFFEPSSRTFSSFASAVKRLGGDTVEFQNIGETSSVKKGESFADTIKTFSTYSDAIIIRHPKSFSAYEASLACDIPVINAGDGTNEHPTQTLLDMYTIFEKFHRLDNITAVLCGDVLHSRTHHSLIEGLSIYPNNTVYLVSPKELKLSRKDFTKYSKNNINLIEIHDEKDIPRDTNVWYWNRIQKERFTNPREAKKYKNKFTLTKKLLEERGNEDLIILDPLPRVGEIEESVDEDPRALYFKNQIENGLYVRMALLSEILEK